MVKKTDPIRKQLKARVKEIAQQSPLNDPFGGLGDWDPSGAPKNAIARVIAKLEGMKISKPKVAKPKTVKRVPKKKKSPPLPKRGKQVAKATEVQIKSPFTGKTQWMPLVSSLSELLAEGWTIVDGDVPVSEAYEFLNYTPEEV